LKLTAEQKKQLQELQKEVDGKLGKILTDEQKKQLKDPRDRGPGGFGPPPFGAPPPRGGPDRDRPRNTPFSAEAARSAVEKALPLLRKGAAGHIENRTCFSCHNQGVPLLALATARERGFDVPEKELETQAKFITNVLEGHRRRFLRGQGPPGEVETTCYALLALDVAGTGPDATTAAAVEYLLLRDRGRDHWRSLGPRPPSEGSHFMSTYLAIRGLQKYGLPEHKERIARRVETVRGWLVKTRGRDTEDRVFRLLGLKAAGAKDEEVRRAAKELADSQREDGGWGQLDRLDSDAYATGSALVALHLGGGMASDDPAYRRGLAFLLGTQREDGSWLVVSRSRPFQRYFESGFPHGRDQFISCAASGWAATALALALPVQGRRQVKRD
jgi:hypothetical protein